MRVATMAYITEEGNSIQFPVLFLTLPQKETGQVTSSKGMCETCMIGSRIDKVGQGLLLNEPQPLKGGMIHQGEYVIRKINITVYGILHYLHNPSHHPTG